MTSTGYQMRLGTSLEMMEADYGNFRLDLRPDADFSDPVPIAKLGPGY